MRKALILFLLFFSGCGYTTKAFLGNEKIYVEPVVNSVSITAEDRAYSRYRSYPILIEKALTNQIISEFNIRGGFKVAGKEQASYKLESTIYDYKKETLRYSDAYDVDEQRLRLYVKLKLYDPENKIIKEKTVVGETTYFLKGSLAKSESAAMQDLIEDTARRIVEAISEEWAW